MDRSASRIFVAASRRSSGFCADRALSTCLRRTALSCCIPGTSLTVPPRPGLSRGFATVLGMADVTKAVIPEARLGTRFLPATKATPKEMLPVIDKPAIQYVVEEAVTAGLNDVLLITGRS